MATHAAIIRKTESGNYEGVYLHSDGYTSHTGAILENHYYDARRVAELIALGSLSCLYKRATPIGDTHSFGSPEKDVTIAYHRDRGESIWIETGDTVDEVADTLGHSGYVYVFEDGRWTVNGTSLRKVLGMSDPESDQIERCAGIPTDVLRAELARREAAAANGLF